MSLLSAAAPGCALIGYDALPIERDPPSEIGSSWTNAGAGGATGSSGGMAGRDASAATDAALPPPLDGAVAPGASPPNAVHDDQDPGTPDAGACPAARNACGGCTALPFEVGASCGVCGLGRFVCAGPEDVVCQGGETLPAASGRDARIDDLEDGDRFIAAVEGRTGGWYTADDGTGGVLWPSPNAAFVPVPDGASGSAYAAHMRGGGFGAWGAVLALSLTGYQCTYDAAVHRGLSFRARGRGTVRVAVATAATTPREHGGRCAARCFDLHGVNLPLTSDWQSFTVPWAVLAQRGFGTLAPFVPSELLYIEFGFGPNVVFDLWVDDLRFY